MALDEVGERGLDEGVAVVAGVGEDVFVFDEFEVIDAVTVPFADELDGLEGAIADVDTPRESGRCHRISLKPLGVCASGVSFGDNAAVDRRPICGRYISPPILLAFEG